MSKTTLDSNAPTLVCLPYSRISSILQKGTCVCHFWRFYGNSQLVVWHRILVFGMKVHQSLTASPSDFGQDPYQHSF